MKPAESNCSLLEVFPDFPYLQTLLQGRPQRRADDPRHPPMDRLHRAKIFAPFDALDGYSERIRRTDRGFDEPPPEKREENTCEFWDAS